MEKTLRSPFLDWRIENFSCWTLAAHGPTITCRKSFTAYGEIVGDLELSLCPRGHNGDGEVMEIDYDGTLFLEEGDVSVVGPDGSLLCTKEFSCHGVLGMKFQEVFSRIEQNEDLHGDHLILKFRCKEPKEHLIHLRTTLKVLDTSMRITQPNPLNGDDIVDLAMVSYYDPYCKQIKVCYSADDKILIVRQIDSFHHRCLSGGSVQCCVSVFDRSNTLVTHKKTVHTLTTAFDLVVSDPMPAFESGGHCILRMKIINGGVKSHFNDFLAHTSPLENTSKQHSSLSVIEDLRCLYQDRHLSDFKLKCGTESFPCHQSILCARSPVFKAMLTSNMKEAESGSVDIEDMDGKSLELFLAFLYSGSFKDVHRDSALKLYYAAEKYQVPALKKECADFLCVNVAISNVCDILCLGDRHSDDQLTSVARRFILKNFQEVSVSKEWQDYMTTNPILLLKMVTDMAAKGYFGSISNKS